MNPNELRAQADKIMDCLRSPEHLGWYVLLQDYAAYLREQADRQEQGAIGYVTASTIAGLRASQANDCHDSHVMIWPFPEPPLITHPVYLHPAPTDVVEALREAALKKMKIAEISDFESYSDHYAKAWRNAYAALAAVDQQAAMQRATDVAQDLGLYESKEPKCD